MMKRIILYLFFISLSSSQLTAQITFDKEDFEGISNQEFIESLDATLKYFDWMEHVMSLGNNEDRDISTERTIPAYQLDTLKNIHAFQHFFDAGFTLYQLINSTESEFSISDDDHFFSNYDKNALDITINSLFFCDGSVESGNDEELDLSFKNRIKTRKELDSIIVNVSVTYETAIDIIELNKIKKSAIYNGKTIKIEDMETNHLVISYDKKSRPFLIEGLNAKKEVLDDYQNATFGQHPKEARKMHEQMKISMKNLLSQATADSAMTSDKFQEKYLSQINKFIDQYFQDSDVKFSKFDYYGIVDGVRLYFVEEKNTLQGKKTIKNNYKRDYSTHYPDYSERESIQLYDKLGNVVYQEDKKYTQLNSYFYEDEKHFYHFDSEEKKMNTVLCYKMEALNDEYIKIQWDENKPYILVNKHNQQELGKFKKIEYRDNIITAISNKTDSVLLIADSGEKRWLDNVSRIWSFVNGYAVFCQNGKYGFVDNRTTTVIPTQYDYANEFDRFDFYTLGDNLFIVKKGDYYGAVNKKNKTVIPFIYKDLKPFSYKITLAKDEDDNYGLINTNNKTIVPFTASGYSLSTNFGRRNYYMNGQDYDYLGRLGEKKK